MYLTRKKIFIFFAVITFCLFIHAFFPCPALSEETYKFNRMWPTLQQPWYFYNPTAAAIDENNNIYIADGHNHRIQKFTANGFFIKKWGKNGREDGEFRTPGDIALDKAGNIYVADKLNYRIQIFTQDGQYLSQWPVQLDDNDEPYPVITGIAIDIDNNVYVSLFSHDRIQKYTSEGQRLLQWGQEGSEQGQLDGPENIAADHEGNIIVADSNNHRIQKFSPGGKFINTWGNWGDNPGEFKYPATISVDNSGNIYIGDGTHRVQKFSASSIFMTQWGSFGKQEGEFNTISGISVNNKGDVFVVDLHNHRVEKFTSEGKFIAQWGRLNENSADFNQIMDVTADSEGNIFVVDAENHNIQKFTSQGQLIFKWGSEGTESGHFRYPKGITLDTKGNIYISDTMNNRIQKFSSSGIFIGRWGEYGSESGQFNSPYGITSDMSDNIYVTDRYNTRIQKFKSDGTFILEWGTKGQSEGQFSNPTGVTSDKDGSIYVADANNNRIQKFTSTGQFVIQFGQAGSANGEFEYPYDVASDNDGNVYVTDSFQNCIQKFDSKGNFITKWGQHGAAPGMLSEPYGLAVSTDGIVYVADMANHRVQSFKPVTLMSKAKAIIVAGGGPYAGNSLWDATQACANFAYRTLTYRGFTKESIYYMTSDTELDLDDNNEPDDVDGDAVNSNLEYAVTDWAKDADSLVIYLTDHGIPSEFVMSETQHLAVSDLNSWLNILQAETSCEVFIIYDACYAGSFLSSLVPPPGIKRIFISSVLPDEEAQFITQGTISFSNYFWTHIFNGLDIKNAFNLSANAIQESSPFQHPQMDANGNGLANELEDTDLVKDIYIGTGVKLQGEVPIIGSVSVEKLSQENAARISAVNVTDADSIARVWAIISPPDYAPNLSGDTVLDMPSADLLPIGSNNYELVYDGFNIAGTYQIAVYASDLYGNTCIPIITRLNIQSPLARKVIIMAGGASSEIIGSVIEKNAVLSYEAVKFQGYHDDDYDDIYFLSPDTTSPGVDGLTTWDNAAYAVQTWAAQKTQDVVLYLIGNEINSGFRLNDNENLPFSVLDSWLDKLQEQLPGKVTVIFDGNRSAGLISLLQPPEGKERILISSASEDKPAVFIQEGSICFSRFFWRYVLNGANVRDACAWAYSDIKYFGQTPVLDDNGNGIGNEKSDGSLAKTYKIGAGIVLAGVLPVISSVLPEQTLNGERYLKIWADAAPGSHAIDKVWAVVIPPEPDLAQSFEALTYPVTELIHAGNGRYEAVCENFSQSGTYRVIVYAADKSEKISAPAEILVHQAKALISGDLNEDGKADLGDAVAVLKVLAGFPVTIDVKASINGSQVRMEDAVYILQKISELKK